MKCPLKCRENKAIALLTSEGRSYSDRKQYGKVSLQVSYK
jgi:hypothetical protein